MVCGLLRGACRSERMCCAGLSAEERRNSIGRRTETPDRQAAREHVGSAAAGPYADTFALLRDWRVQMRTIRPTTVMQIAEAAQSTVPQTMSARVTRSDHLSRTARFDKS